MSIELLKVNTYEKEGVLYCRHCKGKIKVTNQKFSCNFGRGTAYRDLYECDCRGYKKYNPIKVVRVEMNK